jgi:putative nucleotidyltransferase with HDIG domain
VAAVRVARAARAFDVGTFALTASFVIAGLLAFGDALERRGEFSIVPVLVLAAAIVATEAFRAHLTTRLEVSSASIVITLAAALFGPLGGLVVGTAGALLDLRGPRARWLTYTGMYALEGFVGGLLASTAPTSGTAGIATAAILAAIGVYGTSLACTLAIVVVRRCAPLAEHVRLTTMVAGAGIVLAMPVVFGLAYGYHAAGLPVMLLVLVPTLMCHGLLRLYKEREQLALSLSEGNMTFALSLVRALDARDEHTAGHSAAVAVYARDVARLKGLPDGEVAKIQLAALLHDIGKIGLTNDVLNKQEPLTEEEWRQVRRHPEVGAQIAGEAPVFSEIARYILHHHERPDGLGYPHGLMGDRIPLASAIIGVADAYNAMTSTRPYRTAMAPEEAVRELRAGAGGQFDPHVVELFVRALDQHDLAYQLGEGELFSLDGQRTAILAELGARRALLAEPAPAAA